MITRFRSAAVAGPGGDLVEAIAAAWGDGAPTMVLLFASPSMDLPALARRAQARFPAAAVLSATTSGEFTERGETRGGGSAVAIGGDGAGGSPYVASAGIGRGLRSDPEGAVKRALAGQALKVEGHPHTTAFLLVDALAGTGEEATLLASDLLGADAQIAGAAAGDDLAMKVTSVGVGAEVADDAVAIVVLHSQKPLGIGVAHAHVPISGPLEVTRAEGNVVHTIEGRPAWDVWREHTRAKAAERGVDVDALAKDAIGGHLLRYEAGLSTGGAYKIRAPLSVGDDGSIGFACGIPTGAVIRVTESSPDGQRTAAEHAAAMAKDKLGAGKVAGAVVFDCICRRLILDDRFEEAVVAIGSALGGVPIGGFETYGEIAMRVGDLSGFHNTTSVVVAFPE